MSIIRLTFPCQQILKERESLLELVLSTVGLHHRAVGDDAGHQACKGKWLYDGSSNKALLRLGEIIARLQFDAIMQ